VSDDGWRVLRHSGGGGAEWRELLTGAEDQARFRYATERSKLRQGAVSLVRPDGTVELHTSAPRLRTRW
jgi:hypothetical protein